MFDREKKIEEIIRWKDIKNNIKDEDRENIIYWLVDISEKYKFMDITVMQAIFYFDAFCSVYKIE